MASQSSSQPPQRRPRQLVTKVVTVPGNLQLACDQFNSGLFFETHETLEEIWQEEQGAVRDLYKGLIQVAAAFVHVTRGNIVGADRLFRTSVGYLRPYREEGAMGFDVELISAAAERCHEHALGLGRQGLADFDYSMVPNWTFDETAIAAEAVRWDAWGFDRKGLPLEMTITVIE